MYKFRMAVANLIGRIRMCAGLGARARRPRSGAWILIAYLGVIIVEGGYDRLSSYNCRITSKRRRTGYFGVSGGAVTFRNRGGNEE
ncbi:hypothetical protein BDV30DRAFT_206969 [Aspergillus minisclerotigenes]|uniref:Uncharacterized protein n=1 Tax=Aspergillus minisclerotigenes TaxID=656917 RepID=A0A5N6JAI8_9EURO|nr:hypothetical protein BDV30DRAFT_206969 [Aspergillus minisclerotigenes]